MTLHIYIPITRCRAWIDVSKVILKVTCGEITYTHGTNNSISFSQIAALYAVGKSTVVAVVHQGITIFCEKLVPEVILFPTGPELHQVMVDFESLCGLPCCGGALDGTFMQIKKPQIYGDTYCCYKHFTAIIVLGCVDA